jgi:hypothetical protein
MLAIVENAHSDAESSSEDSESEKPSDRSDGKETCDGKLWILEVGIIGRECKDGASVDALFPPLP